MMITFRLLIEDNDIKKKIDETPKQIRSTIYRKALRNYFFHEGPKNVLQVIQHEPILKIELSEAERKVGNIDLNGSLDGMLSQF